MARTASVTLALKAFTTTTARSETPAGLGVFAAPVFACLLFLILPGRRRSHKKLLTPLVAVALTVIVQAAAGVKITEMPAVCARRNRRSAGVGAASHLKG